MTNFWQRKKIEAILIKPILGLQIFFQLKGSRTYFANSINLSIPSVLNEVSFKSLSIAQLSRNRYSEKVAFPSALLLRKQIYKKGKGRNDQG